MEFKLFKAKKVFSHKSWNNNPEKHWHIGVMIFFSLLLVSFCFGAYFFMQGLNEIKTVETEEPKANFEMIKRDRLQKVLNIFEIRKTKSEEIINNAPTFGDPSI